MALDGAAAIGSMGADLSVSVSFVVANELVAAANENGFGDDEVVAMLVASVVVLSSVQKGLQKLNVWLKSDDAVEASRGVIDFGLLLLSIAQRIGLSVCVQLLALSVRATAPSRLARVLTLLSAVTFFLFFDAASTRRAS
jgi:hypothetical protein